METPARVEDLFMAQYIIHHKHDPAECAASMAAWHGFSSPLRGRTTPSACLFGGHQTWWRVEADDANDALDLLPHFVSSRADVFRVEELMVP